MVAVLLNRIVFVAVVEHRAVVATEHHQGVFSQPMLSEHRRDLAHTPVKLKDRVAAWPEGRRPLKSLMHNPWHMTLVRREEQEEGRVGM